MLFRSTSAPLLGAALAGRSETQIESLGDSDVIRGAAPIYGPNGIVGAVVVDYFVPDSVANRSAEIARSFQEIALRGPTSATRKDEAG